jgi:hypothetical protein
VTAWDSPRRAPARGSRVVVPSTVVNISTSRDHGTVYVGRAAGAAWLWLTAPAYGTWRTADGRDLSPHEAGYLGNPVVPDEVCVICGRVHARRQRRQLMACYAVWLSRRLRVDADFLARVQALRGRELGCYCAPRACHGDLLAAAADGRPFCGSCGTTTSSTWVYLGGDPFCGRCYSGR